MDTALGELRFATDCGAVVVVTAAAVAVTFDRDAFNFFAGFDCVVVVSGVTFGIVMLSALIACFMSVSPSDGVASSPYVSARYASTPSFWKPW